MRGRGGNGRAGLGLLAWALAGACSSEPGAGEGTATDDGATAGGSTTTPAADTT